MPGMTKKTGSNFADTLGGRWWLMVNMLFPIVIFWMIIERNLIYKGNMFIFYAVMSMGTVVAIFLFKIVRPNPFTGDMAHAVNVDALSEKDRRVLTFWKTSKDVDRLIIKAGVAALMLILLMTAGAALMNIFYLKKFYTGFEGEIFDIALVCAMLYFFFSFAIIMFSLAMFLKKNIDKIRGTDVQPWPIGLPYVPWCSPNVFRIGEMLNDTYEH